MTGPVFCLLLGVSSDYAQPITEYSLSLLQVRDRKRAQVYIWPGERSNNDILDLMGDQMETLIPDWYLQSCWGVEKILQGSFNPGVIFHVEGVFSDIGIPTIKIRWSQDSILWPSYLYGGNSYTVRWDLNIGTAPCFQSVLVKENGDLIWF